MSGNSLRNCASACFVHVADVDLGAFGREGLGDGPADAVGGGGDHDALLGHWVSSWPRTALPLGLLLPCLHLAVEHKARADLVLLEEPHHVDQDGVALGLDLGNLAARGLGLAALDQALLERVIPLAGT